MDFQTPLTAAQMTTVMTAILNGEKDTAWIEHFLTTLTARGETAAEITGAVTALRAQATPINAPADAVDCCGTGGDHKGTYNISTAVALVAAACGVPMAKHGNRASSSKSGAADVLEALGVNLDMPRAAQEAALREINFAFLMAPKHHGGLRHAAAARKNIGRRTVFNLLGPLVNPAQTKRQLIGVFDRAWLAPMAETLRNLGTEKAWLVCSADGLDEISISGKTHLCILDKNGDITHQTLSPDDFGLPTHPIDNIIGGTAQVNAGALMGVLNGEPSAYRDIVLANTAAVLMVADKVSALKDGVYMAAGAIDNGAALGVLNQYINFA